MNKKIIKNYLKDEYKLYEFSLDKNGNLISFLNEKGIAIIDLNIDVFKKKIY